MDHDPIDTPDNAPNEAPDQADFASIAARGSTPGWRERGVPKIFLWAGGLLASGALAFAVMALQEERHIQQAMHVVAGSAAQDTPAPAPATSAQLPETRAPAPLVLAAAEPPAPRVLPKSVASRRKPLARPVDAPRHPAPKSLRRDRPLAYHPMARKVVAAPAKSANVRPPPSLSVALAQRCKSGDLVRECMATLCREGKKGDPACQALSALER